MKPTRFTLSQPSSAASSRNSSPAPALRHKHGTHESRLSGTDESPGRRPMDVYDVMLPRWRAVLRKQLLKRVDIETKVIARMQELIRTPFLDAYFVYTSSLGTHTFFMTAIPALFFFGYEDLGGGLILILAFGVYLSSVIKDLICSPRPFAPPVTRLSIGSHHLEYGFPSTHSTNSVSIALFLFALIHRLAYPSQLIQSDIPTEVVLSTQTFAFLTILLGIYTFSIVFGRLYTAMHCFTDCFMGIFLGTLIWWAETSWTGIPVRLLFPSSPSSSLSLHPTSLLIQLLTLLNIGTPLPASSGLVVHLGKGLGLGSALYTWVEKGGWEVPLILIPIALLAVNQHPQPVDDCPCFEDAIAFGAVVLGVLVGKWTILRLGISSLSLSVIMPGSGWTYNGPELGGVGGPGLGGVGAGVGVGGWTRVTRTWEDVFVWWGFACLKMVFGIVTIFAWRLLAKSALHLVLPPIYRILARAFELPRRRFYTPATEYESVPSEFSKEGRLLHSIPSVIDLPRKGGGGGGGGVGVDSEIGNGNGNGNGIEIEIGTVEKWNGTMRGRGRARDVKLKFGGSADKEKMVPVLSTATTGRDRDKDKDGQPIRHYDADVLTKVVVYSGIAVLVSEALPALYNVLGWGVRSWPSA